MSGIKSPIASVIAGSKNPRIIEWILPLGLIVLVLAFLNLGLYRRLSPQPVPSLYTIPYHDQFDDTPLGEWYALGGEWELNEGTLRQFALPGEELGIVAPLKIIGAQPYRQSTRLQISEEADGAGLLFNLQYPKVRQNSHSVRLMRLDGVTQLITGYYDPFGQFVSQATVPISLPLDMSGGVTLSVFVGLETYLVLVDDQVVVHDIPLVNHGGWIGLDAAGGQVRYDDLVVEAWLPEELPVADTPTSVTTSSEAQESQSTRPVATAEIPSPDIGQTSAVEAPQYAPGSVVYQGQFQGELTDAGWVAFAGDWAFEAGSLVQRQSQGFDRGIGYQEVFDAYLLRVNLRHLESVGGGILFNMSDPDRKENAHLVRFTDDGAGIFWGFFDETGAFNSQGFSPTPPVSTAPHTLEIFTDQETYSIRLDEQLHAQNIPLNTRSGHVGLTTSDSAVAFDSVEVYNLETGQQTPTTGLDLLELDIISGEWFQEEGVIRQTVDEATDYLVSTGVAAEEYVLSVDILLADEGDVSDSGGGVVFHMPSPDSKQNAHMVRFGNAGQEVFWGYYDADEAFVGQGGAEVDLDPAVAQTLTLLVKGSTYKISVNGETVGADIPLQQETGWISLLSYRGPVTFSNFSLSLGDVNP